MSTEPTSNETSGHDLKPETKHARLRARRNFLKGTSLALPAAMTLTPGTAQALVSITCGRKALDNPLPFDVWVESGSEDDLYRMAVDVYDQKIPTDDGNGGIIMVPNNERTYFYDNFQDVWRNISGAALSAEPTDKGDNLGSILAIVHIDADEGQFVSLGANMDSAPPNAIITSAAGSCMASLMQQTM